MSNYIFAYHGGKKPSSPEESAKIMEKWDTWIKGLDNAFINEGAPVGLSKTVSSSGIENDGGSNPLSGISIVNAESMEAALEIAKGCPHIEHGTIEVAEMIKMQSAA
jgi:hypothetical protein